MAQHDRIAILIPCFNEGGSIRTVVTDCRNALPEAQIYVYDNNSSDATMEEALQAGAVVRTHPVQGKGSVVSAMLQDIHADCYILIDGDDTYCCENLPEMAEAILSQGFDLVIGDRLSTTYFSENKRLFHSFGNRLVTAFINLLFGSELHDVLSGYRGLSRKFVSTLTLISQGFELETELTAHALKAQIPIKELPTVYRDRKTGHSKISTLRDGSKILVSALKWRIT